MTLPPEPPTPDPVSKHLRTIDDDFRDDWQEEYGPALPINIWWLFAIVLGLIAYYVVHLLLQRLSH